MKDIDRAIIDLSNRINKLGELDALMKTCYEFIRKNADYLNWDHVCYYAPMKIIEKLADDFEDDIVWIVIQRRKDLIETFIEKKPERFFWVNLCDERKLSEEFMRRNLEKLEWNNISIIQNLSESFMADHFDKIEWRFASKHQKLSMSFIKKHLDKLPISTVLIHQNVSRDQLQEITQTKEFQYQLTEGLRRNDTEWMRFKTYYYADALYDKLKERVIIPF